MPNRLIKETIRTSKKINSLSDFEFRTWAYLVTYVDDYGRGSADPEILKGFVFPRRKEVREQDIQKALAALERTGSILLYEVAGEPYFCFPNWSEHQRIQTKKSKYPAPSDSDNSRWVTVGHGESPPESNPNPNPNPKESVSRATRFTPPTVEEVAAYCLERKNHVDPQRFVDFYAAKGWMVGKNRMKDWKAAVRTWEQRDGEKWGTESKNSNIFLDMLEKEMAHE